MTNGGMRQAMIELEDEDGQLVELRESFALSNVKEPLLALGKLMRVISMDFCFSRGDDEVDVEVKEDLRIYQGDLRGGTCLV